MHSNKLTESSSTCSGVCSERHPRVRRTANRLALLVCLTLVCSGCSLTQGIRNHIAYNDACNDFVMGWRNNVWSRQAWHSHKRYFADHPEFRALGAGFRDGYQDVAGGGSGCPPPVPPRNYWTWKYQTPEGQCKVAAWFEGYSHGARAAEEVGAGNFQDIQVSYAIEVQYSPEFQASYLPQIGDGEQIVPEESIPVEQLPGSTPPFTPPRQPAAPPVAPASWDQPAVTGWPNRLPPTDSIAPRWQYGR